jgi:hypothetical protein
MLMANLQNTNPPQRIQNHVELVKRGHRETINRKHQWLETGIQDATPEIALTMWCTMSHHVRTDHVMHHVPPCTHWRCDALCPTMCALTMWCIMSHHVRTDHVMHYVPPCTHGPCDALCPTMYAQTMWCTMSHHVRADHVMHQVARCDLLSC